MLYSPYAEFLIKLFTILGSNSQSCRFQCCTVFNIFFKYIYHNFSGIIIYYPTILLTLISAAISFIAKERLSYTHLIVIQFITSTRCYLCFHTLYVFPSSIKGSTYNSFSISNFLASYRVYSPSINIPKIHRNIHVDKLSNI